MWCRKREENKYNVGDKVYHNKWGDVFPATVKSVEYREKKYDPYIEKNYYSYIVEFDTKEVEETRDSHNNITTKKTGKTITVFRVATEVSLFLRD